MTCEVAITIAPQTVTVEIADPDKIGTELAEQIISLLKNK